jgi:hypothetical protein
MTANMKPQGGKKHRGLVAPRLDHDMKAIFKSADRFRLCAKPYGEIYGPRAENRYMQVTAPQSVQLWFLECKKANGCA